MSFKLYPYQLESVNKLKSGSILCGGVGSGKSPTSLYYYYVNVCGGRLGDNYAPMKHPKDLYIITTARKRDTLEWQKECLPFLLSTKDGIGQVKVVIDSWNNISKYKDVSDSFFIFDEQRVVGSGSWVKAFLEIAKHNLWIMLSATPGDTWLDYIPVFIANGFYKNKTEFTRRHIVYSPFTSYPKVDRFVDTGILLKLRKQILVDMKYIKKNRLHHAYINVEYDKAIYEKITKDRWDIYKEEPIRDSAGLFYIMRRAVNSDISRLKKVSELIGSIPRVIIFYNFNYELELLRSLADTTDSIFAEWNGHKHEPIPETDRWVYLVQYTAGAEGWNCVATDTIIFYSQNYSYKIMEQSAGRIDRINTTFTDLYYYHLQTESSIDLAIFKALKHKRNFNESNYSFA